MKVTAMENSLLTGYALSVALTHVLFSVIVLRLYQLVKSSKLCEDSWGLRIGVVLAVTGTLTLSSIPITSLATHPFDISRETMFWSMVRTIGLIVLCFVIFHAAIRNTARMWDGEDRRDSTDSRQGSAADRKSDAPSTEQP